MKITAKRLIKDEKGQALLITLLFLVIGSLLITPTLNLMGTGIKSGRVYEQKIDELYAADAGVEDALWNIRYDFVEDLLGAGYDEYDYSTAYDYPYDLDVNGKDVDITIQNVWIPKDIPESPPPAAATARQIIEDEKLIIIGYPSSEESTYEIKIVYYWESGQDDDLKVETIGIWLSPGFEYVDESCDLDYSQETISLYKGGYAVVWDFASQPTLKSFPVGDNGPPMVKTFDFEYTGPEGQLPELVSSWIDTTGVTGISYSWDDSIRLYKIVSEAGGVQIEAYGAKTKFRKLKSTISSDYATAGNTLMESTGPSFGCWPFPDSYYRDRLYAEEDSTILRLGIEEIPESGIVPAGYIPEEAIIEDVYLYWTGWRDYHYYEGTEKEVCGWVWKGWPQGWVWECHWEEGWEWDEIPDLKYPNSPTEENLTTLVEESAKVNIAKLDVDNYAQTITADKWQVVETEDCFDAPDSWAYSCFTDVTDLLVSGDLTVREYIEEAMKSDGSGTVTFTMGHADEVRNVQRPNPGSATYYFDLYDTGEKTGYPLATPAHQHPDETCYTGRYNYTYSGWSLIIFYRSPALKQRQLYLFDDFIMATTSGGPGGTEVPFTISGFLAPPVLTDEDKSHLTYFVGEGDAHFVDSYIDVNDVYLSDPPDNPQNNVFNSYSNAIPEQDSDGIDFDIFELPTGCILPYDTSAEVTLTTTQEIYFLVYIVLSFRSDLTTGGIITNYSVKVS
jgi:hypothetical protein